MTDKVTGMKLIEQVNAAWVAQKESIAAAANELQQRTASRSPLLRRLYLSNGIEIPLSSKYDLVQKSHHEIQNYNAETYLPFAAPKLAGDEKHGWYIAFDGSRYTADSETVTSIIIPRINALAEKLRNEDAILLQAARAEARQIREKVERGEATGVLVPMNRARNAGGTGTYGAVVSQSTTNGGTANIISLGESYVEQLYNRRPGDDKVGPSGSTILMGKFTRSELQDGGANVGIGDGTYVKNDGVAIGQNTYADGRSVALGAGSRTLPCTSKACEPEVSVGDAGDKRRDGFTRKITNVTKGVNPTDAATMANLSEAVTGANDYTDKEVDKLKENLGEAAREQVGKALEGANAEWGKSLKKVAEEGREGGTVSGSGSYAAGKDAMALNNHSVALGEKSMTTRDYEVNIGSWETTTGRAVGSGGTMTQKTRILSGVSGGEKDDEAVNRKQLNDVASTANRAAATAKDEAVRDANKYTNEATLKANEKVLKEANTYTDDTAKKTLKTANEQTERRAVVAEKNAVTRSNAYTDESSSRTLERANTYTNHRSAQAENNAVARSNAYTDNRFGELRKSLQHTEKRLNAGIAGVTAISSIPYAAGNKFSYGIGAGNYQNGNAIAAGVQFRVSQSANVRLNVSWDSAGNNATGVGIAGGW
ncbi:hypothetical protein A0R06_20300 [Salmonella enterica]|nr:hypothetical protein [Salmonella enterica]